MASSPHMILPRKHACASGALVLPTGAPHHCHSPPSLLFRKVVELLLVIPFTLGFKTSLVSELLALTLVLEASTTIPAL